MLLPYYLVYKALIRAKIALYRLSALVLEGEGEDDDEAAQGESTTKSSKIAQLRSKLLAECEGYISIAWHYMSFHPSSELLTSSVAKTMSQHKCLLAPAIIVIKHAQEHNNNENIIAALVQGLGSILIAKDKKYNYHYYYLLLNILQV